MRLTVLVGLVACGGTPSGPVQPTPPGAGSAPVIAVADPDGPLCAVLRSSAPRSVLWAQHGCPPSPAPLVADRRPCRVHWGTDVMDLRYDASGRLSEVTNRSFTTRYSYDDGGRLIGIGWGGHGKLQVIEVVHEPNVVTYKSEISEHRATIDAGNMTKFEIDDNHVCALERDERGGVRGLSSTTNGEVTAAAVFTREPSGLLVRRTDGQIAWTYAWDPGARLVKIAGWESPITVDYTCTPAK